MADITNKEAIEIITHNKDGLKKAEEAGLLTIEPCLYEAFEVAIKALEQKPILDKTRAEIDEQLNFEPNNRLEEEYQYGLTVALNIINKHKAESED